jgi:hypothetical protein
MTQASFVHQLRLAHHAAKTSAQRESDSIKKQRQDPQKRLALRKKIRQNGSVLVVVQSPPSFVAWCLYKSPTSPLWFGFPFEGHVAFTGWTKSTDIFSSLPAARSFAEELQKRLPDSDPSITLTLGKPCFFTDTSLRSLTPEGELEQLRLDFIGLPNSEEKTRGLRSLKLALKSGGERYINSAKTALATAPLSRTEAQIRRAIRQKQKKALDK